MKQSRKVALINVADYPKALYSAYWGIDVQGNDEDGYQWRATLFSYEPIAWLLEGKVTTERPDMPWPQYPPDIPVTDVQYRRMKPDEQAQVRAAQEARRKACRDIYERHPKGVFEIEQATDVCVTRDEADTAAQQWVLDRIEKHRRQAPPASPQAGYALPLGPAGMLWDIGVEFLRWLTRPLLMALAFSTTIRTNRITQVLNAIDGGAGAGLWRIYDGSRPSTCGTATTLLAEITLQDPSGTVASQQLTFDNTPGMTDSSANATGTATWFRIVDSTGTCCVDGDCGTSGSDLNLNSTSINSGVQVTVSSAVITEGNA